MGKKMVYRRCDVCGERFLEYYGCRTSRSDYECLCKECNEMIDDEYMHSHYFLEDDDYE